MTTASRIRVAGLVLLAAHLVFVGWLTLRPRSVPWVTPPNLHPFATIRADLADGPRAALEGIGGGLLLLAPLGVLLPLAAGRLRRPLLGTAAQTVIAGALVAMGIALLQSWVPWQVANIDSVMLNTAGVALAQLLAFPPLRRWILGREDEDGPHARGPSPSPSPRAGRLSRRDEGARGVTPRSAQGAAPRATRVGIAP
ncbi:VanZ family protein [Streptomyces boncukensis]|uniref:VanZ family protein n=1 Tax=Streptomyces boncukensis TaxID=2711219 RepID=UPI0030BA1D6C